MLDALPDGSVTAFEGANLFMSLALGLFSISPALAYYSRLSADAVGAPESFPKTLLTGVKLISFLTVPAGVALLLLAAPAVQSVLNWMSAVRPTGGMEPAVVRLSVLALAPLGLAVFPVGVSNLLIRTFYVRRRIRTPVIISFVFILLNALLYFVLAPPPGYRRALLGHRRRRLAAICHAAPCRVAYGALRPARLFIARPARLARGGGWRRGLRGLRSGGCPFRRDGGGSWRRLVSASGCWGASTRG